jgi:hypothetical protein
MDAHHVEPMNVPLLRTIERLARPHFSAVLVSPAAERLFSKVAEFLPASVTSSILFEARLGRISRQVDLSVFVQARGLDRLAQRIAEIGPGSASETGRRWERLARLCRGLRNKESEMSRAVGGVWLEFDLDGASDRLADLSTSPMPFPGVFLDVAVAGESGRGPELFSLVCEAFALLRGRPLPPGTRGTYLRCLRALPESACVEHVGSFPGRSDDGLRLCIARIPDDALEPVLASVGRPGDPIRPVQSLQSLTSIDASRAQPTCGYLHLDIAGSSVLPRVSREYAFDRRAQVKGRLREAHFLDRLVVAGLCTPEESAAIVSWPGWEAVRMDHELWESLAVRRVNHVKLVFDGDRDVEAKVYFGIHHQPRPARRVLAA